MRKIGRFIRYIFMTLVGILLWIVGGILAAHGSFGLGCLFIAGGAYIFVRAIERLVEKGG